jgi:hypothetical protein
MSNAQMKVWTIRQGISGPANRKIATFSVMLIIR